MRDRFEKALSPVKLPRWRGLVERMDDFAGRADAAAASRPGYPECVAMLVQIGDHLSRQYDVKG